MTSLTKRALIICGLSILLVSCTNNKEHIAKVESLQEILGNTEEIFAEVDTAKVLEINKTMEQHLLYIQKHYNDTVNKDKAMSLSNYYNLKKGFHQFVSRHNEFRKEIDYGYEQLNNMITDLENGTMPVDSFSRYYEMEMESILDLNKRVQSATNVLNSSFSKYETQGPDIKQFYEELKQQVDSTASE